MLRVLDECDNVAADFGADPVHDLRVSLRRCRSVADGMRAMDPDPDWKQMKKAGKDLFQRLGALRDVQIMMEWIEKLELHLPEQSKEGALPSGTDDVLDTLQISDEQPRRTSDDPPAQALLHILKERETQHKHEARAALEEFDRKQWRQWSKSLPRRSARIRPGNTVFRHLALERWTAARELHIRAMRSRSQVALHTLRIGIKRFRYIVENFLPQEHRLWSDDLKRLQDLLGEVHDLDVLWKTAADCQVFADQASRKAWHARIIEERKRRIDEYRQRTVGPDSLWNVWRAGLPQGKQIREIATRRMKLWAKALDPDFAHSERVARLSLQLYDGLAASGLLRPMFAGNQAEKRDAADLRSSLHAAALLHDVGKVEGNKGHHKKSLKLIKKHGTPLGWNEEDMRRAGLVARFHAGALPRRNHQDLRDLSSEEQRTIVRLSAFLRLANAFDINHDAHVRKLIVENASVTPKRRTGGLLRKPPALPKSEALVIIAEGYRGDSSTAQAVATERYLLERVLRRPVFVRPGSSIPSAISRARR